METTVLPNVIFQLALDVFVSLCCPLIFCALPSKALLQVHCTT